MHPHVCIFFVSLLCLWHCKQLLLSFRHSPSGPFFPPPPLVGRHASDWQIGSVCCGSAYGRRSMWLPASAIRNGSLHWGKCGLKGEGSWHKKRHSLHALANSWTVRRFCLASSCFLLLFYPHCGFFCWQIKSFLWLCVAPINRANFALISHIRRCNASVCSFLFCFWQLIHEGYPLVSIWLNCGVAPSSFASFAPDAITFPLAHHLRPASAKLLLLGHPPKQWLLRKSINTNCEMEMAFVIARIFQGYVLYC